MEAKRRNRAEKRLMSEIANAEKADADEKPTAEDLPFGISAWADAENRPDGYVDDGAIVGMLGYPFMDVDICGVEGAQIWQDQHGRVLMIAIPDPEQKLDGAVHVMGGEWVHGKWTEDGYVLGCHIPFDQIWLKMS